MTQRLKMTRRATVITIVALSVAMIGTWRDQDDGVHSTALSGPAGGSEFSVPTASLPLYTDVVVRGTVVNVAPAALNTPTGGFPDAPGSPAEGIQLIPTFEVTIRPSDPPSARRSAPGGVPDLPTLTLRVFGGFVRETMHPEKAIRWGAMQLIGEEGPGSYAVEIPPTTPQDVSTGYASSAHLAEGDVVTLFLRHHEIPMIAVDGHTRLDSRDVWILAAGSQAVFTQRAEGWAPNGSDRELVDDATLLELARQVQEAAGEASVP